MSQDHRRAAAILLRLGPVVSGALAVFLLGACATTGGPVTPTAPLASHTALPVVDVPDLEERALLLMLADRRMYEPITVQRAFEGSEGLREALAVALGRIADPRGEAILSTLLRDDSVRVRRAAAFALGEAGISGAERDLRLAAASDDRELGSLAVEALGKLGVPLAQVGEALAPLADDGERWARLLPFLFRFPEDDALTLAVLVLDAGDASLRAGAAHALGRNARPDAAPYLRRLLGDDDPWIRGWGARGLGTVGEASDLARLVTLVQGSEPGPAIQALRAARKLIEEGKAAAPTAWVPRLLELLGDERPQVRLATLEVAGLWLLDDDLGDALAERARGEGVESRLALLALAEGGDPRARDLAHEASRAREPRRRAMAARAAARLGDEALLERLAHDPAGRVRVAVLEERLGLPGDPSQAVTGSLVDTDPAVKATAFEWLREHPLVPLQTLGEAVVSSLRNKNAETSLEGVRALAARAKAEPLERGALVALLENLAGYSDGLVRREAVAELGELGRPQPAVGPFETAKDLAAYETAVQRTYHPRTVEVRTDAGSFRLRLACPSAPLTCLNFLSLARQGFYDGITFHRVVPDFVVQGGDPRGDGYGGPGYTLRDEINRLRYTRGVVGMALSGPDTGGSQFFVTLSPQPHLDGGYTAFGEVVSGLEVVERLVPDSRILGVVEVP